MAKFKVLRGLGPRGHINIDDALLGRGSQGAAGPAGAQGPAGDENSTPLSNTVFVDGGTSVPLAQQNGSIGRPFETLTQGLNAMGASTAFTVFLTPGDYSGEGDIALLSNPNTSIGIIGYSAYYGLGALTPELSATLPGFSGGHVTQILHFVNCIWNTRPITPAGIVRMDWCRILGASGSAPVTANSISINYSTITQRITIASGLIAARNVDFLGTGALITVTPTGGIVQAYLCRFDPAATISIVFTNGSGLFQIDGVTNFHWKAATETLTGGSIVMQDNITP